MNNQSAIERTVMRRVHLIRILQLIISTAVFALLTFVVAIWGIGKEVWVARVFQNAPPNLGDLPDFYIAAFMHTNIIVQVLTVCTLLSLIFLVRETVRLVFNIFAQPRS